EKHDPFPGDGVDILRGQGRSKRQAHNNCTQKPHHGAAFRRVNKTERAARACPVGSGKAGVTIAGTSPAARPGSFGIAVGSRGQSTTTLLLSFPVSFAIRMAPSLPLATKLFTAITCFDAASASTAQW